MGAGVGLPDQFSLPPLEALSFLPFLFLQVVLLHPRFSPSYSRPIRFLLIFPAVYFAFSAPFKWRIEPLEKSVGANFRWGIFGPNFVMKALEWGFAKDTSVYTWIGCDVIGSGRVGNGKAGKASVAAKSDSEQEQEVLVVKANGKVNEEVTKRITRSSGPLVEPELPTQANGATKLVHSDLGSVPGRPSLLKSSHALEARNHDSAFTIFVSSIHLAISMRGIGYAFGPTKNLVADSLPRGSVAFLKAAIYGLIKSHIVSTISLLIIIHHRTTLPIFLGNYLPFVPPTGLQYLSNILAYLSVGMSLHAQMVLGFDGFSICFLLATNLLRFVLPKSFIFRPPPFDSRQYPPLFNNPFAPQSVTHFWGECWHLYFKMPFVSVGYYPVVKVVTRLMGKQVGRAVGAYVVFGLSCWMHDQAFWSARHGLPLIIPPLTFTERYGAHIFFFGQATAVILEGLFTKVTGRKVGGWSGRAWSYGMIIGVGMLAGRSWIALGLVKGLPTIQHWGWQRFIVPSVALAPPPLFTV